MSDNPRWPPNWLVRAFMRVSNFLIRPTLSKSQAVEIMQEAARAKGWPIGPVRLNGRDLHLYRGIAFIDDEESDVIVIFMIDGRSGEILLCARSDEMEDLNEEPAGADIPR